MKALNWIHDQQTELWANRLLIPIQAKLPKRQYDGLDYRMREVTWQKHILSDGFPDYCRYPNEPKSLLASPANIIRCFQDQKLLEALALTVAWGRMTRAKVNIYQNSNQFIEKTLRKCIRLINENDSVAEAWNLLTRKLQWEHVMTSKCLHFLARSLGYEMNPPVPIDKTVFIQVVWPVFKKKIVKIRDINSENLPKGWWDPSNSWEAYNRFMTAINCWASVKGWTTTQLENTLFQEYYPG
jgi:hypothetical protein